VRKQLTLTDVSALPGDLEWLPFRFERLDKDRVLVTNEVGEHTLLTAGQFDELAARRFGDPELVRRLRGLHIVRRRGEQLPVDLLAVKVRTRYRRIAEFTSLHMFVVTLRCEHSCRYCQVSRQSADKMQFDMSSETADRALDLVFSSPSPSLKIEFQGGEPLLNFPMVRHVVERAIERNQVAGRDLSFVIASNLALLDDTVIRFCERHGISVSTSLDGPRDLHDQNRPRPGNDSWVKTVEGVQRLREALGPHSVSALMTTTEASLPRVREIVDSYVDLGLHGIFLRPLSPYGFAAAHRRYGAYDTDRWAEFYREGLDYIIDLNRRGTDLVEFYASVILKKMLSNEDPRYVDLSSPAGLGIGALLYNYDGDVFASDEGRMLGAMGDATFRLGNVGCDSYDAMMTSDALLDPLEESFAGSVPMCVDCAFEPFCGSDPVFHYATMGDFIGRKPESAFCRRNMAVFRLLIDRYQRDRATRELFHSWVAR
jgi:His-Xaa-Ser system radical SAM maturase HxsB